MSSMDRHQFVSSWRDVVSVTLTVTPQMIARRAEVARVAMEKQIKKKSGKGGEGGGGDGGNAGDGGTDRGTTASGKKKNGFDDQVLFDGFLM